MDKNKEPYLQIWQAVSSIPRGNVTTYGRIADLAGFKRAARYVGYALKQLPDGSEIPWHRVISSKGEIAFPKGSRQHRNQRKKLIDEGILFNGDKIDMHRFGWIIDLDSLLWKPEN